VPDDDDDDDDDRKRKRKFYGRTGMTKVIFAFRNFATAPNNGNDDDDDDDDDDRRKIKLYSSTSRCKLTHNQLIF
jgi:hypothetical protein